MSRSTKIYEDESVEVYRSLHIDEIEDSVIRTIKNSNRPLSWKELRSVFSGIVGEDKLRKILIKLIEEDKIVEMPDGTFGLPQMIDTYIPNPKVKRVRPLVPSKFYDRWGSYALVLRRAGRPLGELLKMINAVEKEGSGLNDTPNYF